jgi:Uma2 family endonuclease
MSTALRFSVEEFDQMLAEGLFDGENQRRVELIHGEILEMAPPGPLHEDIVDLLNEWSFEVTDRRQVRVRIQNTVGIPELDSVPLPDVVWVREQSYRTGRPQPGDIFLIIEVADSSLKSDRDVKGPIYAEAGVQDYWIANLRDFSLEVYRKPAGGAYGEKRTYQMDETATSLAFPDAKLELARLYGG